MKRKYKMYTTYKTREYDKFTNSDENRDVRENKKLHELMKLHGFKKDYPIHVLRRGDKFVIRDGGHRFSYAKQLGLDVYFQIVADDEDISISEMNNSQRKWSQQDYLNYYIKHNNSNYIALRRFWCSSPFDLSTCIGLLSGSTGSYSMGIFRSGAFHVRDMDFAIMARDAVAVVKPHIPQIKKSRVCTAFVLCLRLPEFDLNRFLKNARRIGATYQDFATREGIFSEFERIYNDRYSAANKIPLKFMTMQLARSRKAHRAV